MITHGYSVRYWQKVETGKPKRPAHGSHLPAIPAPMCESFASLDDIPKNVRGNGGKPEVRYPRVEIDTRRLKLSGARRDYPAGSTSTGRCDRLTPLARTLTLRTKPRIGKTLRPFPPDRTPLVLKGQCGNKLTAECQRRTVVLATAVRMLRHSCCHRVYPIHPLGVKPLP